MVLAKLETNKVYEPNRFANIVAPNFKPAGEASSKQRVIIYK